MGNKQLDRIEMEIEEIDNIVGRIEGELKDIKRADVKLKQGYYTLIARYKSEKNKWIALYNSVEQDLSVKRFLLELQIDKLTAEVEAMAKEDESITDMDMLKAFIESKAKKVNLEMQEMIENGTTNMDS